MDSDVMEEREQDYYQKLRQRIRDWTSRKEGKEHRWTDWVMLAPDLFHLLIRLVVDPEVSINHKAKLAAAIAYFISPFDLLPEIFLGPAGFLDDVVITAHILNSLINNTDSAIVQKHWAGEKNLLEVIQKILRTADKILGSGLLRRLKRMVK